jgi:hypothetical protein
MRNYSVSAHGSTKRHAINTLHVVMNIVTGTVTVIRQVTLSRLTLGGTVMNISEVVL